MSESSAVKVFAVIGDPIGHSLSPLMHNAAFRALGLPYVYVPFHVKRGALNRAIEGIRALQIPGVNVTIPHKERCVHLVDMVSEDAAMVGAVNTIVNDGGRLSGYNTDVEGFSRSLESSGIQMKGNSVAVLGAGGASRSVVIAAAKQQAAEIHIFARDLTKAEALVESFRHIGVPMSAHCWGQWVPALVESDIVVNATPLGMKGVGGCPLPGNTLLPHQVAVDIVYNPMETQFLKMAQEIGCRTVDGVGMLVHQGAEAFRLFTGYEPPVNEMRRVVICALTGAKGLDSVG